MIDVTLSALPNQSLSILLDGFFYDIAVRECNGCMSATIERDGVTIISNVRITAGTPLLPYRYQEPGNFLLTVEGDSLPDWEQFGITQSLVYVTPDELAAYRA